MPLLATHTLNNGYRIDHSPEFGRPEIYFGSAVVINWPLARVTINKGRVGVTLHRPGVINVYDSDGHLLSSHTQ